MRKINNEKEYDAIMERVNELVELVDDTTSAHDKNMIELDFLTDLVVVYEKEHYPIVEPSLSEVMKLRMYEMGLTQKTLAEMLEISPSRVSEIISEKSEPTLSLARKICRNLNISASVVLGV